MKKTFPSEVQMIPIHQIDIINPRMRDQKEFNAIVANIDKVGLKKPITVTPRRHTDPKRYYLVCGQGRLEAFIALAQDAIPAFVINASEEECMIMSLVENIARRQHQPIELFLMIAELRSRGYSNVQIGKKIGMSDQYVGGFVHLLENGEEGLIRAVANGNIPISVAMDIAGVEGKDAMQVLQKGYESGELRGAQFLKAKRIIERRLCWGKKIRQPQGSKASVKITSKTLMDTIQREAERQRFLVRESQRAKRQMLLVETAMRKLRSDMGFVNLLRALKLDDIPEMLDEKTK